MSQHNDIETPNSFESDASLRMALRGLPREIEPANDLWPGIAARIQAAPAQTSVRKPARRPWAWPVAMAASLLVATGLAWQVRPSYPQPVAAATPASKRLLRCCRSSRVSVPTRSSARTFTLASSASSVKPLRSFSSSAFMTGLRS